MTVYDNGTMLIMSVEEYMEFRKLVNPPKTRFVTTLKDEEPKECLEVEVTTREYDHAEAIKRATENLCGEEEK